MSSLIQAVRYKDMAHVKRVAECFPAGKILPKRLVTHKSSPIVKSTFDIYKLTVKDKCAGLQTVIILENPNFKWDQMRRLLVQINTNYDWSVDQFVFSNDNSDDNETIVRVLNKFQGFEG